jgi:hypothetical protein
MERLRSIGAAVLLAGMIVLVIAPWLGVWAVLSSNIVWWTPLVVGLLVSLSGGTMLFLTWAHDRGEAKAKAETIDEFTLARIRNVWAEEEAKLRRQIEEEALLQEFVERGGHAWKEREDGEGPADS